MKCFAIPQWWRRTSAPMPTCWPVPGPGRPARPDNQTRGRTRMQPASDAPGGGGSSSMRRWGPIAAIVVVIAIIVAVVAMGGGDDDDDTATTGDNGATTDESTD